MRIEKNDAVLRRYISQYELTDVFTPELMKSACLLCYKAGERVMRQDEQYEYVAIIADGLLRVCSVSPSGKAISLAIEKPPSLFGDIEFLLKRSTLHDVVAETDTILIAIPIKAAERHLEQNLAFYKLALSCTIDKLHRSSQEYTRTLLYPTKNRFARYLVQADTFRLSYNKNKLAEHFGVTPRHMGRILSELEAEGIIKREQRGVLEIINEKELQKLAAYL